MQSDLSDYLLAEIAVVGGPGRLSAPIENGNKQRKSASLVKSSRAGTTSLNVKPRSTENAMMRA